MLHNSPTPSLLVSLVHHYDDLVDYIRRRFGDNSFAREVVHEVCVQLMEKPQRSIAHHPVALLKRISHNTAVDQCRAEDVRRRLIDTVSVLPDTASPAPDPASVIDAQREIQCLADAVAALPRRCQQVFVMHKIHEVSQADVAVHLGISLKMVEKHLRLGMAACRQKLGRGQAA